MITAPPPTGLYALGPVLAGNAISGPRATVTQIEQGARRHGTVAGINGDFFSGADSHPNGIVMQRRPDAARADPRALVDRLRRERRHARRRGSRSPGRGRAPASAAPLTGVNQRPRGNRLVLFTPAWGADDARPSPNAVGVVLQPFPRRDVNTDLTAPVTLSVERRRARAIPPDGAVLVATGADAAKLPAEAPAGQPGDGAADPPAVVGERRRRDRRRAAARPGRQGRLPHERELRRRPSSPRATRARRSASSPTAA